MTRTLVYVCAVINKSVCAPQKNISTITAPRYRVSSDEPVVYESNKHQVRENEIDMLTMRETQKQTNGTGYILRGTIRCCL